MSQRGGGETVFPFRTSTIFRFIAATEAFSQSINNLFKEVSIS
jgi:hypothetical protein